MLKAYFDGSGTHSDSEFLTLAGLSASEASWSRFEAAWCERLDGLGLSHWHTAVVNQNQDPRTFWHCVSQLQQVILRAQDVMKYSATVVRSGYRKAESGVPALGDRGGEAGICVNACVGTLVVPTEADFPIALFFDQGEPFLHTVKRIWQEEKHRPRGWASQILSILPLDSKGSPPLQAADLLAWITNRYHAREGQASLTDVEAAWFAVTSISSHHRLYDCDRILAEYANS